MSDSDVKVQITGLKKDIENVTNLNTRLDTAIEKLTDVSTSIKQSKNVQGQMTLTSY